MNRTIHIVGFWSGLVAFLFTFAYCIVQLLQVGRAITSPLDEILIYGTSQGIVIPLLLAFLALHYSTPAAKKIWSHAAQLFITIYAVFVTANYVVQLATVIPAQMQGSVAAIGVLEQKPHLLLWDFDAIGYIFMGLATLVAVPLFAKQGLQRWVCRAFVAHALVTPLISVVYFYPTYSQKLLMLGYPWGTTARLFMLMPALHFRSRLKRNAVETNSQAAHLMPSATFSR